MMSSSLFSRRKVMELMMQKRGTVLRASLEKAPSFVQPPGQVSETQLILRESLQAFTGSHKKPFENALLVTIQHCLGTTFDMLAVMKEAGLEDAVFGGKSYSTHAPTGERIKNELGFDYVKDPYQVGYGRYNNCMHSTVLEVWRLALEKIARHKYDFIIALDDGADLLQGTPGVLFNGLKNKPDAIIGVEQTKNGSDHPSFLGHPFPVINVAGSFSKTYIEYPLVAQKIVDKLEQLSKEEIESSLKRKPIVGIIGSGTMGKAVEKTIKQRGFSVIIYDKREKTGVRNGTVYHHDPVAVIVGADIIVGCTGTDVTSDTGSLSALVHSPHEKWLLSTSSKDIEFNNLLRVIQNKQKIPGATPDPLGTIHYKNNLNATLTLVRGGFPINFDNSEHSVEPQGIWPTRAGLLHACLYGANFFREDPARLKTTSEILMLPPKMQLYVIRKYIALNPENENIQELKTLSDSALLKRISENSEGSLSSLENLNSEGTLLSSSAKETHAFNGSFMFSAHPT